MTSNNSQTFSDRYLKNLLTGNRAVCSSIAHEYLAGNPSIQDLYEDVFKVALYEIGRLWETNKITVATEHLATAITEGILNEMFEQIISEKRYNKKVVVACVENEYHQVGIKMVADVFELNGWESFFLGAGIPIAELIGFVHQVKPDILAISLSVYFNYSNLVKMLESLRIEFPGLQLLLGGQAFGHLSPDSLKEFGNIIIIKDLYLLEKFISTINANH
jgi:MerR family transcriptional regulator, light-induced transcriptional regulator